MTGGPPKIARKNARGRERQRTQQEKIMKESKMKKQWLRDQQCEARKRCQEKEAHRAERSHTEKRRGAQRQTMMPNQGKTRRKQKHLACDPNVKEQEPIAKGNPSIVIKSVRKTHLTQRVTPSGRNTNETNRRSRRSDQVGEPTTDTRPRQT